MPSATVTRRVRETRPEDVADALTLAAAYLTLLPRRERNGAVGWNYGSAAGSSIPHPHLQVVASSRLSEAQAREQRAEARFAARTGRSFWAELLSAEAGGPRCLGGAAGWSALVAFAPRGLLPDVLLVARDVGDLGVATAQHVEGLANLIVRLSRAFGRLGIGAWNLVITPTTTPRTSSTLRARLVPRLHPVESTASSDVSWIPLGLLESVCCELPEVWAERLGEAMAAEVGDENQNPANGYTL